MSVISSYSPGSMSYSVSRPVKFSGDNQSTDLNLETPLDNFEEKPKNEKNWGLVIAGLFYSVIGGAAEVFASTNKTIGSVAEYALMGVGAIVILTGGAFLYNGLKGSPKDEENKNA